IFEKLGIKTFRVSSRKTPEQRDLKSASERLHAALRCQPYESSSLPPHIKKALEGMFTFIMGD
ncbi:MAG: hypothetical protein U1C97_03475, partial [Candidatus Gracilibacteria bacterium]|nr:hypothetical protein [Candidatus Gracilibacteria bacterium]